MTNAFAAAAAAMAPQISETAAESTMARDTSGNLAQAWAPEESQLFSGPVMPPSLLNKTHLLNSVRTGIISQAPYDVHARDYNTKLPKYFLKTPVFDKGKLHKVGPIAIDPGTGEKNQPVKDTVVVLGTDYRFDAAESAATGRDVSTPDDGTRAFYASGDDLKQLRNEIRRLGLRSSAEMVGLRLTVARIGQKPNDGGNPSWITKVTLERV